jgi:hypothetical protein
LAEAAHDSRPDAYPPFVNTTSPRSSTLRVTFPCSKVHTQPPKVRT